jgi:hypothetical protein
VGATARRLHDQHWRARFQGQNVSTEQILANFGNRVPALDDFG